MQKPPIIAYPFLFSGVYCSFDFLSRFPVVLPTNTMHGSANILFCVKKIRNVQQSLQVITTHAVNNEVIQQCSLGGKAVAIAGNQFIIGALNGATVTKPPQSLSSCQYTGQHSWWSQTVRVGCACCWVVSHVLKLVYNVVV